MYFCQITNKMSEPCEKLNKIVVASRTVQYKHWDNEAEEFWFSSGSEIVKEANSSDAGVALWNTWSDEDKQLFASSLTK
jgi:hypothetical protein